MSEKRTRISHFPSISRRRIDHQIEETGKDAIELAKKIQVLDAVYMATEAWAEVGNLSVSPPVHKNTFSFNQ